MSQRKTGVLISYITLVLNAFIGLLYTRFMIDKLGDGLYGIYSIVNSLITFVTLLDLGFGQTLVRYIVQSKVLGDKDEEHRLNGFFLKLYTFISFVAFTIGVCIVNVYPMIASNKFSPNEIYLFKITFSILLANVVISFPISVFSATLNAYEEFFALKLSNLIMTIIKYLAMFLLLEVGYKLVGITLVAFACSIGVQIFYVFYAIKKINIKFSFDNIQTDLKNEIFHFSFYIFLNIVIDFLYSNTDKLILGAVSGTIAVSIYSVGVYFSQYFSDLSCAMSGVFMPKVMELYKEEKKEELSNLFNRIGHLQMALLFLVLGGFVCLGGDFINLWVGEKYSDSYIIGLLIMVPSVVPLTQNIGISIIRAMNIHKYRSYMYIVIATINVVISVPLAKVYGGIGSAIGTCIATILGQVIFMNIFYAKKVDINIKEYWTNLFRFTLLTATVVLIVASIKNEIQHMTWGIFILMMIIFSLIYIVLFLIFLIDNYEKDFFLKIIKRRKYVD